MAWLVEWLILWKMIMKMLTHIHMVVYTWWYWHICKGEVVGVEMDQLGEEKEVAWEDRTLATGGPDLEWVSPVINPRQGATLWSSGPRAASGPVVGSSGTKCSGPKYWVGPDTELRVQL